MALSNKERQEKWLAKNRALFNFRRRAARTVKRCGGVVGKEEVKVIEKKKATIAELRELIKKESGKKVEELRKPLVYRDDYGRIISEKQFYTLQKAKEVAKEGGYMLDEYVQ